jgi:hypothetical protein
LCDNGAEIGIEYWPRFYRQAGEQNRVPVRTRFVLPDIEAYQHTQPMDHPPHHHQRDLALMQTRPIQAAVETSSSATSTAAGMLGPPCFVALATAPKIGVKAWLKSTTSLAGPVRRLV